MNARLCILLAAVGVAVGGGAHGAVPLAYVRTLSIAPIQGPPELGPLLVPGAASKSAQRKWLALAAERKQMEAIRAALAPALEARLPLALGRVPALAVIRRFDADKDAADAPANVASVSSVERAGTAVLSLAADRFGLESGYERAVWVHVQAYVRAHDGPALGPFEAVGMARTARQLLRKGYGRTDAQLVEAACGQAAARLTHTLVTGEQHPFAHAAVAAIVPASMPPSAVKRTAGDGAAPRDVPVPAVVRQADVLFQPEVGPMVRLVDRAEVAQGLADGGASPGDLWRPDGTPNAALVVWLAGRLGARYLFISRVTEARLKERSIPVAVGQEQKPGVERTAVVAADGALLDAAGQTLWRKTAEGATSARTEYVRQQPRLRTDEQCVADAARIAYALLRFDLADRMKRYDR